MRILLLFLALVLPAFSFAADTSFGSAPAQPSVQERLAKARVAIDAQDWNAAMRELNVAVREAPRNADVHNLMGYTYRKRANPDLPKAYEHYETALKIDPNHRGAHEYLGEAYLQDKRLADAELHLVALERICGGKTCEEYEDLAKSISAYKAKN
jgi:tetratricopeptide (TPR) repeat protein